MSTIRRFVAPLGAIACLACSGAFAAPDCSVVPSMSPLQQRIAARAAEGTDVLRNFVVMRQAIYQFDVHATMEQGAQHHAWLVQCGHAATAGAPPAGAVAKVGE
jgi:hypothetical protein